MLHRAAWPFIALAGLAPLLLMSTSGGSSAGFYLLVLTCLVALPACLKATAGPRAWQTDHSRLALAMWGLTAAVGIGLASNGAWSGAEFEKALRLGLVSLMVAVALRLPAERLRYAVLGFIPAAWYAAGAIAWLAYTTGARPETKEFNAVSYGNLTLLFGMISLMSVATPVTRWRRTEAAVKLLTAAAALAGFILTQTRGGWLAVPVFLLIGLFTLDRHAIRWKLLSIGGIVAVAAAVLLTDQSMQYRLNLVTQEYAQCKAEPLSETSVCIRMQLWQAAWNMFESSPMTGVGGNAGFRAGLAERARQGTVAPVVAEGFGEAHNDVLYYLATYGLLGGLGLLAIYLAPAWFFLRNMGAPDLARRAYAGAGLALCLGFAMFGLSEMMFRSMRTASLYAIWIAVFIVLCRPANATTGNAGDPRG